MASTLKINTLTGVTTAGSIAVTGEGNSTTTNLQQGLCKSWVNLDSTGTASTRDSFNVSSITDNSTGKTTITVTNAFANANFAYSVASGYTDGGQGVGPEVHEDVITTSSYGIGSINTSNSAADSANVFSLVAGDLA